MRELATAQAEVDAGGDDAGARKCKSDLDYYRAQLRDVRAALETSKSTDPKQLQATIAFWEAVEERAVRELATAQAEVAGGGDDVGARKWQGELDTARARLLRLMGALRPGRPPAP